MLSDWKRESTEPIAGMVAGFMGLAESAGKARREIAASATIAMIQSETRIEVLLLLGRRRGEVAICSELGDVDCSRHFGWR